jgi:predicted metal-dependent HD superfamily phosphohydrolase
MKENPDNFQIDDRGFQFLKEQWSALTSRYTNDSCTSDSVFFHLAELYRQKHRAYHNLSHVYALLSLGESFKVGDAVRFAVWFHDAVYDTRRGDNEEKSAELAESAMNRLGVPGEMTSAVHEMILATKKHDAAALSGDAKLFLDLDLSILGADEEIYAAYSRAVRREYSWVPLFLYRRSRKKILAAFSQKESIYFTREMRERFDLRARLNTEKEIASLSD